MKRDPHAVASAAREWPIVNETDVRHQTLVRVMNEAAIIPANDLPNEAAAAAISVLAMASTLGIASAHTLADQNSDITPGSVHETVDTAITDSDQGIGLSSDIAPAHTLAVQNIDITPGSVHEMVDTAITASDQDIGLSSDIALAHTLEDQNIGITPGLAHEMAAMVIMASDKDIGLSSGVTWAHTLAV